MAEDWGVQSDFQLLKQIVRVKDRFVIDAGCGSGALCRKLAAEGARVLGLEPDPVQAEKNRQAPTVANVGYAQNGAAEMPVEPASVDGVVFANSLHHVPATHFEMVFAEVLRVLKPDGFLYVQEPVANDSHQYVMELFHNETDVRLQAYRALVKYAHPAFARRREIYYDVDRKYASFDAFADHYAHLSYNTGSYSGDRVRTPEVRERFAQFAAANGAAVLRQPMRINCYSGPRARRQA